MVVFGNEIVGRPIDCTNEKNLVVGIRRRHRSRGRDNADGLEGPKKVCNQILYACRRMPLVKELFSVLPDDRIAVETDVSPCDAEGSNLR